MLKPKKLLILGICGLSLNINFNDDVLAKSIRMDSIQIPIGVPITVPEVPVTTVESTPTTQSAILAATEAILSTKVQSTVKIETETEPEYMYANGYVYVRDKKSKDAAKKFLLYPGTKVRVIKKYEKWAKVSGKNGTGYVSIKNLSQKKKEALKSASNEAEWFKITGYDSCEGCCGVGGGKVTKSGRTPIVEHTIAADLSVLPMYTEVYIEGLGIYTVEDIGGGINGNHIDVYCNNHEECYGITGMAKVSIIE